MAQNGVEMGGEFGYNHSQEKAEEKKPRKRYISEDKNMGSLSYRDTERTGCGVKKRMKMFALALALVMTLAAACAGADEMDSQELYWQESGRAYLYDMVWYGRGTKLNATQMKAFFRQHQVTMDNIENAQNGFFAIYQDGGYYGRASYTDQYSTATSSFTGTFTEVWQLTPYVFALVSENIQWMQDDLPEAMQRTMILTIPGIQAGMTGALKYEIERIAGYLGLSKQDPLPCYFITAFDSGELWYSGRKNYSTPIEYNGNNSNNSNNNNNNNNNNNYNNNNNNSSTPYTGIYGLTIDKLATRDGPGTQYNGKGTYFVKGQYIKVLTRAWDSRNGIWWVKCEIPYHNEIRVLWTGYKRFDHGTLPLESIPIDPDY